MQLLKKQSDTQSRSDAEDTVRARFDELAEAKAAIAAEQARIAHQQQALIALEARERDANAAYLEEIRTRDKALRDFGGGAIMEDALDAMTAATAAGEALVLDAAAKRRAIQAQLAQLETQSSPLLRLQNAVEGKRKAFLRADLALKDERLRQRVGAQVDEVHALSWALGDTAGSAHLFPCPPPHKLRELVARIEADYEAEYGKS